jgi:hypothetical protein
MLDMRQIAGLNVGKDAFKDDEPVRDEEDSGVMERNMITRKSSPVRN